jgi:hypothetical protein
MVSSISLKKCACAFSLLLALTTTSAIAQTQRPKFAHPIPTFDNSVAPATALQTWNGTFTYQGHQNAFTMVGTDPSSTNVKTTIPVFIIPLKVVFTKGTTTKTFDPAHKLPSGKTVIQQTTASPMFQSNIDWVQGGTDLGKAQYIDAYQRGNFWTNVMTNTNYHVVLGKPTIAPTITVNVPANQGTVGKSSFGPPELLGIISFSWFMQQAPTWIAANPSITPNALPIFVTYNTYLSETTNFGGCCIGGYHYAYGNASTPQTYAHFAFMDQSTTNQVFSSDVSALSHEIGEWMDDPYINNTQGACGGILENGDPLENTADFGDFIQTVSGYDYHIQDLVFLKYFGQTPSTSVNGWWTFQNYPITSVCQFGQ